MNSSTRRARRYCIDWVQLTAALIMIVSYAVVIALCFAPVPPAPASTPAMLVCLSSTTVWLARREEHDGGEQR